MNIKTMLATVAVIAATAAPAQAAVYCDRIRTAAEAVMTLRQLTDTPPQEAIKQLNAYGIEGIIARELVIQGYAAPRYATQSYIFNSIEDYANTWWVRCETAEQ